MASSTTSISRHREKRTSMILRLAPYRILTFLVKSLISLVTTILMLRRLYVVDDEDKKLQKRKRAKEVLESKDIASKIKSKGYQLAIFYGSQTGTAEGFAQQIAKEYKQKFGLSTIVAELDQYDMKYLDRLPSQTVAVFIIASYGEGEPTDNAVKFFDLLQSRTFSTANNYEGTDNDKPLGNLKYCIFGLGNSSYPVFNGASKSCDKRLNQLGACRLGEFGMGDDNNAMEEDFCQWKENTLWPQLEKVLNVQKNNHSDSNNTDVLTTYTLNEIENPVRNQKVYHGELSMTTSTEYSVNNPYLSPLSIRDIFTDSTVCDNDDRHYMHIDFDLQDTNLTYSAGDHLAMWPVNIEAIVLRTASIFGLHNKLDTIFDISRADNNKLPFPVPTTYHAALRHYLDICKIPSRQVLTSLIPFAPSENAKQLLEELTRDVVHYKATVVDGRLTLVDVLESVTSDGLPFAQVPFAMLIDIFGRLQPRFYSICSSPSESPKTASVTCVTLKYQPTVSSSTNNNNNNADIMTATDMTHRTIYGINTNFLWYMYELKHKGNSTLPISYALPREQTLPMYIRHASNFKMPEDVSVPIIMVGPGTGVAPFRGFVRERAFLKQQQPARHIGATLLFFGCRRSDQDFLYKDEWPSLFDTLGAPSKLITAFSRESPSEKVYVQHRLKEHGEEVWQLIQQQGAYFYVCGDANRMARDVQRTLKELAQVHGALTEDAASDFINDLRKSGRYQEDVWA